MQILFERFTNLQVSITKKSRNSGLKCKRYTVSVKSLKPTGVRELSGGRKVLSTAVHQIFTEAADTLHRLL